MVVLTIALVCLRDLGADDDLFFFLDVMEEEKLSNSALPSSHVSKSCFWRRRSLPPGMPSSPSESRSSSSSLVFLDCFLRFLLDCLLEVFFAFAVFALDDAVGE